MKNHHDQQLTFFQVPYPNNLLRNVGRSSVPPWNYIFVVDVDMMCNEDLYESFLRLAQQRNLFANKKGKYSYLHFFTMSFNLYHTMISCKLKLFEWFISDKRVFIVASFESKQKLSPSLSKQELVDLWNHGNVQPFYYQVCWKCQRHLDYNSWKR